MWRRPSSRRPAPQAFEPEPSGPPAASRTRRRVAAGGPEVRASPMPRPSLAGGHERFEAKRTPGASEGRRRPSHGRQRPHGCRLERRGPAAPHPSARPSARTELQVHETWTPTSGPHRSRPRACPDAAFEAQLDPKTDTRLALEQGFDRFASRVASRVASQAVSRAASRAARRAIRRASPASPAAESAAADGARQARWRARPGRHSPRPRPVQSRRRRAAASLDHP